MSKQQTQRHSSAERRTPQSSGRPYRGTPGTKEILHFPCLRKKWNPRGMSSWWWMHIMQSGDLISFLALTWSHYASLDKICCVLKFCYLETLDNTPSSKFLLYCNNSKRQILPPWCVFPEPKPKGLSLVICQCIYHVAQQHCNGLTFHLQKKAFTFLSGQMTTHSAFSTKTTRTTHSCSVKGLTPQAGRKF